MAEKLCFDSLWLNNDVYHLRVPLANHSEGLSSLVALAELTKRLTVGTLVSCNGFRAPAILAKMAGYQIHSVRATHYGGGSAGTGRRFLRTIRGYALGTKLAQIDT